MQGGKKAVRLGFKEALLSFARLHTTARERALNRNTPVNWRSVWHCRGARNQVKVSNVQK